jgi:hypothetical protein
LTGLIWCDHCKGPVFGVAFGGAWQGPRPADGAPVAGRGRTGAGGSGSPSFDDVEAAMLDVVRWKAADLRDHAAARAAQLSRSRRAGLDVKTVDAELKATQTAMARITKRWGRGLMPDVAYDGAMAESWGIPSGC